jgi:hypothetical protein
MKCPHCLKLGFEVEMNKDGHSWVCRLCKYKTEEKADESNGT